MNSIQNSPLQINKYNYNVSCKGKQNAFVKKFAKSSSVAPEIEDSLNSINSASKKLEALLKEQQKSIPMIARIKYSVLFNLNMMIFSLTNLLGYSIAKVVEKPFVKAMEEKMLNKVKDSSNKAKSKIN